MSLYSNLCILCNELKCEYSAEAMLKDYTSFKIGGKADLMVFPDTEDKISSLLNFT